jgi:hypothetical protein
MLYDLSYKRILILQDISEANRFLLYLELAVNALQQNQEIRSVLTVIEEELSTHVEKKATLKIMDRSKAKKEIQLKKRKKEERANFVQLYTRNRQDAIYKIGIKIINVFKAFQQNTPDLNLDYTLATMLDVSEESITKMANLFSSVSQVARRMDAKSLANEKLLLTLKNPRNGLKQKADELS